MDTSVFPFPLQMSLSSGFKLSTISRGFGKIKGKFRLHSSLSTTPEVSATPTSPSMDFGSEDGVDDSDDEDACYDQVCTNVPSADTL